MQLFGIFPESRKEYIRPKIETKEWEFCKQKTWGMSLWYQIDIEARVGARFEIENLGTAASKLGKALLSQAGIDGDSISVDHSVSC